MLSVSFIYFWSTFDKLILSQCLLIGLVCIVVLNPKTHEVWIENEYDKPLAIKISPDMEDLVEDVSVTPTYKTASMSSLIPSHGFTKVPASTRRLIQTDKNQKLYCKICSEDLVIHEVMSEIKGGSICRISNKGKVYRKFQIIW